MPRERLTYSIIIPVYNKWALTAACLDALGETLAHRRSEGEIIVVDDASTDETPAALRERNDVDVVVRHPANTGFQGAATDGAQAARGDVIIFLNNDTTPLPGWLDALLEALAQPGVGVAGAMFLFPDGRVQEFGGIVWRDASAYHIGAARDPGDPLFSRSRDVDYVSGAGMALRKTFWNELGGFDPNLRPAYYEDTDLCMKARAAGKRVVVTPRSRIVHVMGGSKDVDPRRSHDTMMGVNRQKFYAKWKPVLDRDHWPPHRYFIGAASDRAKPARQTPPLPDAKGKRLLFVYAIVPQYDRQSGDRRLFETMLAYREAGHAVTLLAFTKDPVQAAMLGEAGIDVWHGDNAELVAGAAASTLEKQLQAGRFDLVYFGSPQIARMYLGLVRNVLPGVPVITDAIDLTYHRLHRDRLLNDVSSLVSLPLDRQWEIQTYAASDALTSVSEEEERILRASGITAPIEIVSNFYSSAIEPEPFAGRSGVVMVLNMAHHPNLDGLRWFMGEIWPRVLTLNPAMQLTICGNGTHALKIEGAANVSVTGYLPSIDPVFQHARVNVASLRVGAGVKGKVTEAMRNGLPTVTTPIGAEGLGEDGKAAVLVETDADRFAHAIVALHDDETLWTRLSRAGRDCARKRFSREAYLPALQRLLEVHRRVRHFDGPPTIEALDEAFADPDVSAATFAVGADRDELVRILWSEPSIGAIVGAPGKPHAVFETPVSAEALVVSRAAYQLASMRGKCATVVQFLARLQERGLMLACVPNLPHAMWSSPEKPLLVDVCVCASTPPERIAAIVAGVRSAGKCRLHVVPKGDLNASLPGEIAALDDADGPADIRLLDGKVVMPSILGLFDPLGAEKKASLDAAQAVDASQVQAIVETWSRHRTLAVMEMHAHLDVAACTNALIAHLKHHATKAFLIARDARQIQLGWACGVPVSRYFDALPQCPPGWSYAYGQNAEDFDRLLARGEHLLADGFGNVLAARIPAENAGAFSTPAELADAVPAWVRALKNPHAAVRSDRRTAVFVLGMHRSGTSLLAAVLSALGVRLSEDLMPGNAFNERGYFESLSIAGIQDDVLSVFGSSWSCSTTIKPLPPHWWKRPEIAVYKQRLIDAVKTGVDSAAGAVWACKDPRTARLLPLWEEIVAELDLDARYVLAIRDPRDVARSLATRDAMPAALSELLWLEHNAGVLGTLGEKLHSVVCYDAWFTEPAAQAARMFAELGFDVPDAEKLYEALDVLIADELRHHSTSNGAYALPYSRELYQALLQGDRATVETLVQLFAVNSTFSAQVVRLIPAR